MGTPLKERRNIGSFNVVMLTLMCVGLIGAAYNWLVEANERGVLQFGFVGFVGLVTSIFNDAAQAHGKRRFYYAAMGTSLLVTAGLVLVHRSSLDLDTKTLLTDIGAGIYILCIIVSLVASDRFKFGSSQRKNQSHPNFEASDDVSVPPPRNND